MKINKSALTALAILFLLTAMGCPMDSGDSKKDDPEPVATEETETPVVLSEPVYYTLTTSINPNSITEVVTKSPLADTYLAGTTVTLTAPEVPGYNFLRWEGVDSSGISTNISTGRQERTCTTTLYSNSNVIAIYALTTATLHYVSIYDEQGNSTIYPVVSGESITIKAPRNNTNRTFIGWEDRVTYITLSEEDFLTINNITGDRSINLVYSAPYTPVNISGESIDLDRIITSSIVNSGESKFYEIYFNSGTTYKIETYQYGDLLDTVLNLYSSNYVDLDQDYVANNDDIDEGAGNKYSRIEYAPTSSGVYYIRVTGFNDQTGSFKLNVTQI